MTLIDIATWLSLATGIVSIIIGIFAIVLAGQATQSSQRSLEQTQLLLSEIDKKAALINQVITGQQAQLVDIINRMLDRLGKEPISSDEIEKITDKKINPIKERLESQPRIFSGPNPPPNPQEGDIWIPGVQIPPLKK